MTTAYVLGGGGVLGTTQLGMLRALAEHGVRPDLVVGTSIGALNGAFVAADPSVDGIRALAEAWRAVGSSGIFLENPMRSAARIARFRTHLLTSAPLRSIVDDHLPVDTFEELEVAVPVRGRVHRDRRLDVVLVGRARRPRRRVVLGARALPGGRDRRPALPRRRARPLDPRGAGASASAPTGSSCSRSAGSSSRSPRRAVRGRSGSSRSRSPGATATSTRWSRSPTASRCTSCRAAPRSRPRSPWPTAAPRASPNVPSRRMPRRPHTSPLL